MSFHIKYLKSQKNLFCITLLIMGSINGFSIASAESSSVSEANNNHQKAAVYEAIIFDCDGVLVDTEYTKFLAWKEALAPYGVSFSLEDYKPILGNSSKKTVNLIMAAKKIKLPAQKVISEKNAIYKKLHLKDKPKSIQSAVSLVRELVKNKAELHIKVGLASSPSRAEIMWNLKAIGLENAFDVIISGHDDLKDIQDPEGTNKPKPYIYQRAAKWLKVQPQKCLVFEDSAAGVTAAVEAGMTVFAVPNEYTKQQNFSNAARILNSLSQFNIASLR